MALDASDIPDGKVDTSKLSSLLNKTKVNTKENKSLSEENSTKPNSTGASKGLNKPLDDVKSPFDSPSNDDLNKVKDRLVNQFSRNTLSPGRHAQFELLASLSDSDGFIRKSQKELAEALGFKDRKGASKVVKYFCDKGKLKIVKSYDSKNQTPTVYKVL